jgi:hypothetical protein
MVEVEAEAEATATATQQGSWIPLLLIVSLISLRWLCYTDGATSIRIRRWYNMQVRVRYVCCACMYTTNRNMISSSRLNVPLSR